MRTLILSIGLLFFVGVNGTTQSKKVMTPDVYSEWNRIGGVNITDNGDWAMYTISKEVGDKTLHIYNTRNGSESFFKRTQNASFDKEGIFAVFMIGHAYEEKRSLQRKKTKKKDMPKDTLCIYNVQSKELIKIPDVKSYKTPQKWGGYVAYLLEPAEKHDTIKLPKKESTDNGSKLILYNLNTQVSDTLLYAQGYGFSKEGMALYGVSKGGAPAIEKGLYSYNFENMNWGPVIKTEGEISSISWDEKGSQLAFIMNNDTTDNRVKPYELHFWNKQNNEVVKVADQNASFLPKGYNISNYSRPLFSKKGTRLIFQITPPAVLQDTSLLDDEIVQVEVWHHDDAVLYTEQEVDLNSDQKKDYIGVFHLEGGEIVLLENEVIDRIYFDEENDAEFCIGVHTKSYDKERMWQGHGYFDGYRINVTNGKKVQFADQARGRVSMSPKGNYCFWYDASIEGYWSYDVKQNNTHQIASKKIGKFGNEQNDRPMDPYSYGYEGFSDNDEYLIIYDRYDIWLFDPTNVKSARKITNGRASKLVHRIIDMDDEKETTDLSKPMLLHVFDEKDKSESYVTLDVTTGIQKELFKGDVRLDRSPVKAMSSDDVITTVEDYTTFPNLVHTNTSFQSMTTFTDANPQQEEYAWGTIQLHSWTSLTGSKLNGLLVLPENFDSTAKYPLIVNFYERSSDRLNRHRAPYAHRSTINYSYYSSKGYILFNPDVEYRIGYPGQSCYESVIPGVQSLIEAGFIDEDRIGVQGHSWGGYQIADLLTKTDIFACAEAGAPVVNMVSAYGGIRWGSGMSRMFQYEKTQSRLGATLWERPDLYLENSPIFKLDKVTTPVLILHNDEDGAVPWYQGIEYFNAMRRLGKVAWFLNYNKEPHWPVKWQNRKDFNIRMEQFFDHYLKDAPMPRWMEEGVPALKKGIDQGLDYKK